MNRKVYLAILTFIVIAFAGNYLWQRFANLPRSATVKPASIEPNSPPIVSTEIQWDDENEIVFRDWEAELEEILEPLATAKTFEAIVEDGEMMVTEATEVEPGVFHFTTLTPHLRSDPETGAPQIEIQCEKLALTLDGGLERIVSPSILVRPNALAAVSTFTDERQFSLTVSAEEVATGIRIRGSTSESDSSLHAIE